MDAAHLTFLTDVKTLRARARQHAANAATSPSYQLDVNETIDILQSVLATEIVCMLRYSMNAIAASGVASSGAREEFIEHANEEREHMLAVAERISQLGGAPNFNPQGLLSRATTEYVAATSLAEMIRENLIAERIAVDHYRELIRFFGDKDPGTRILLEKILVVEEEHANDMQGLLEGELK